MDPSVQHTTGGGKTTQLYDEKRKKEKNQAKECTEKKQGKEQYMKRNVNEQ